MQSVTEHTTLMPSSEPSESRSEEELIESIRQYAAEGWNKKEIAELTGKSYYRVRTIVEKGGIQVKDGRGRPKQLRRTKTPEIDTLLTGQYTLQQIADLVSPERPVSDGHIHLARERVRQYIKNTGQYETFRANRKAFKESERAEKTYWHEALVRLLERYLEEKLPQERFVVQLAVEYDQQRKRWAPIEKILRMLEIYERAIESGQILTLEQLARKSRIKGAASVSKIFKALNLEPFHGRRERHATPKENKDAIRRAYKTKTPLTDVAYFLGLKYHVVAQNMRRWYGTTGNRQQYIARFGISGTQGCLNYHTASQIYLAHDLWGEEGVEGIVYCFGGRAKMVRYALEHRHEIEPKIIHLLNVLYPDVRHDKPYL